MWLCRLTSNGRISAPVWDSRRRSESGIQNRGAESTRRSDCEVTDPDAPLGQVSVTVLERTCEKGGLRRRAAAHSGVLLSNSGDVRVDRAHRNVDGPSCDRLRVGGEPGEHDLDFAGAERRLAETRVERCGECIRSPRCRPSERMMHCRCQRSFEHENFPLQSAPTPDHTVHRRREFVAEPAGRASPYKVNTDGHGRRTCVIQTHQFGVCPAQRDE